MGPLTIDLAPPPSREEFAREVWMEYERHGCRVEHRHFVSEFAIGQVQPPAEGFLLGRGGYTRVIAAPCPTPEWFLDLRDFWHRYTPAADAFLHHDLHSMVLITERTLADCPEFTTLPVTAITLSDLRARPSMMGRNQEATKQSPEELIRTLLLDRWMHHIRREIVASSRELHGTVAVNLRTGEYRLHTDRHAAPCDDIGADGEMGFYDFAPMIMRPT